MRADFLDVLRLGLYWAWAWAWAVWKTSGNVRRPLWTPAARIAALAGLGLMVMV